MAIFPSSAIPAAAASSYSIDQSLRFNDDDSAYLQKTPSSAGNKRTFTHSFWVKRGNLFSSSQIHLFTAGNGSGSVAVIQFDNDSLRADFDGDSSGLKTTQVFRDTSAWYHFVIATDSTIASPSGLNQRVKIYCNGTQITDLSISNYPTLNEESTRWNNTVDHRIGMHPGAGSASLDAYLAEVHFVDGTALTPTSFGEFDADYNHWKPIEVSGLTYGTNGFYLPFKHDTTTTGFSIVKYTGNNTDNHAITGVGFQPDLVWTKVRSTGDNHMLWDSIRGANKAIFPDTTGAENDRAGGGYEGVKSFDADGFTLGLWQGPNWGSKTFVAWCWEMGGTLLGTGDFTQGTIASTCKANIAKGQSMVSYTGTGTGSSPTVGHGLGVVPDVVLVKRRDSASAWPLQHSYDTTKYFQFQDVDAASTGAAVFDNVAPTSSVFTVNSTNAVVNASGGTYVAYCFSSVTGYSSIGTYTGNGSASGPSVTCGFKPRFVILKVANASSGRSWYAIDNDRGLDKYLVTDVSNAEGTGTFIEFTSTGFDVVTSNDEINDNGSTHIYMAFADTREALLWADKSGNSNDWTANNIDASDEMLDSPTNNFATLNSVDFYPTGGSLKEGNLELATTTYSSITATQVMDSGKWYWEVLAKTASANTYIGIRTADNVESITSTEAFVHVVNGMAYRTNATIRNNDVDTSYGATYTSGDIISVLYDADNGTLTFWKNGVTQGTAVSSLSGSFVPAVGSGNSTTSSIMNFGQDSSFAGNVTAGTETDDNSNGSFKYDPPTDFLALCTNNLPEPAVKPQENFNVVAYTGTGTTYNITGVGFQPDLVILKGRSIAGWHGVFDSVRGVNKRIHTDGVDAEQTRTADLNSFDSDGFQTDDSSGNGGYNSNTDTYVAWNWKAGTSASGTTSGSGTLKSYTASYNADAGFSIIKYEGNGTSNHKIPHHLGVAPDLVIVKNRDIDINWVVGHSSTGWGKRINLNNTSAHVGADTWNYVDPTTTLVNLGGGDTHQNGNGANDIMYCFASKEGYSKVFSHVGNGSSDGTFVYLGFKPAYALFRSYDNADAWFIFDRELDEYNVMTTRLRADNSYGPDTGAGNSIDFVSNGIKFRSNDAGNGSGKKYIGIAFAEHPFKYTTAR